MYVWCVGKGKRPKKKKKKKNKRWVSTGHGGTNIQHTALPDLYIASMQSVLKKDVFNVCEWNNYFRMLLETWIFAIMCYRASHSINCKVGFLLSRTSYLYYVEYDYARNAVIAQWCYLNMLLGDTVPLYGVLLYICIREKKAWVAISWCNMHYKVYRDSLELQTWKACWQQLLCHLQEPRKEG